MPDTVEPAMITGRCDLYKFGSMQGVLYNWLYNSEHFDSRIHRLGTPTGDIITQGFGRRRTDCSGRSWSRCAVAVEEKRIIDGLNAELVNYSVNSAANYLKN